MFKSKDPLKTALKAAERAERSGNFERAGDKYAEAYEIAAKNLMLEEARRCARLSSASYEQAVPVVTIINIGLAWVHDPVYEQYIFDQFRAGHLTKAAIFAAAAGDRERAAGLMERASELLGQERRSR